MIADDQWPDFMRYLKMSQARFLRLSPMTQLVLKIAYKGHLDEAARGQQRVESARARGRMTARVYAAPPMTFEEQFWRMKIENERLTAELDRLKQRK